MAKPNSVEALRQEVRRLRSEGKSFGRIGSELGITKQYAHKLWKMRPPPSTEASTGSSTGTSTALTVRQRRFAAGLIGGKTQRQAAIDAGAPPAAADMWAYRTLRSGRFQSRFHDLLDRAGLSEEAIAQVHAENLQATKVVGVRWRDGDPQHDVVERPDYSVRQRAVRDGWQVRGVLKAPKAEANYGSVILTVTPEMLRTMEIIRGSPMPPGAIRVIGEEPQPTEKTLNGETGAPTVSIPPGPGQTPDQSRNVPQRPPDTHWLTVDEAIQLARRRGEAEEALKMFEAMTPYRDRWRISGETFNQICDGAARGSPEDTRVGA